MSRFSDALQRGSGSNVILLQCSDVRDIIIPRDLCPREFYVALTDFLRQAGFDNVVYFDPGLALGKYVYDDQSARYSIPGNETAPAAAPAAPAEGMPRFGRPRKPAPSGKTPAQAPASTPESPEKKLIYQQKNLTPETLYAECDSFMRNTTYRTAVVFTDLHAFMASDPSVSRYSSLQHDKWRGDNLLIFLQKQPMSCEFAGLLKTRSWFDFFFESCGENRFVPKANAVFSIRSFGIDETIHLLRRRQLLNGLTFPDGVRAAADKLLYAQRQAASDHENGSALTLRALDSRICQQLDQPGTSRIFDDAFLSMLLGQDLRKLAFDPWYVLEHRAGWESVTAELHRILKPVEASPASSEPHGLMTERFEGSGSTVWPTCPHLPDIFLAGNPGTGKTTSVHLIGRIAHDAGLLPIGHVVTAKASDLISDVIGGTAIKVGQMVEKAEGGILHIDEAYTLCRNHSSNSGSGNIFNQEAIDALVNFMTDDTRHVLFIFSGYSSSKGESTDGIQGLFQMNPGLKSRITEQNVLTIPDYSPDVLHQIFNSALAKTGYSLDPAMPDSSIQTLMENIYQSRDQHFGNARFVEKELIEGQLLPSAVKRGSHTIQREDFGKWASRLETITMDSVRKEFGHFPGLDETGLPILDRYLNYRKRLRAEGTNDGRIEHIVLVGNPGTGKTQLAKLLCRALYTANLLSRSDPIEVTNTSSIRPDQLQEAAEQAVRQNTLLFIDEAHRCSAQSIAALLNPMTEDHRLTCVFAVQRSQEENFWKMDSSLKERCIVHYLPDYTTDQMMAIFKSKADAASYVCKSNTEAALRILFKNWYDTRESTPDFSNARAVVRLCTEMENAYYGRCCEEQFTQESVHWLEPQDIPEAYSQLIASQSHQITFEEAMQEFDNLYGMSEIRNWIKAIYRSVQYKKERNPDFSFLLEHPVFVGAPGTGKTSAAKILGKAFYALGLVSTSRFCSYKANDLIAGFIGQTALKTKDALARGRGGVIFIDEAYALAYDANSPGDSYKKEAVEYLLTFAEESRKDTVMILAGYDADMNRFMESNVGLHDRFTKVHFRSFSDEECAQILLLQLKQKNIPLAESCLDAARELLAGITKIPQFSNARTTRNIAEEVCRAHIARIQTASADEPDVIIPEDIYSGVSTWHKTL